jgi:hypothetical protein
MYFILQRLYYTKGIAQGDFSQSFLFSIDRAFKSMALEDTKHFAPDECKEIKVPGSSRIPAGIYQLKIRKVDSDLTKKHRQTYKTPWFIKNPNWYHIEIVGIPGFQFVYVHSGNDDAHTLGCVLPCYTFDMTKKNSQSSNSLLAVNDFYALAYPLLEKGIPCFIDVRDEILK